MWILFLLLSCLLGYLTISFWRKDFCCLEKVCLSFCLGMGEVSLLLFFLGLCKVSLTRVNILFWLLTLCFFLFALIFLRKDKLFKFKSFALPKLGFWEKVFAFLILFLCFWSLIQTIVWPPFAWDVLALYDFRAKVIAEKNSLATDFFTSQPRLTSYNYVYSFSTSLMHSLVYIGGGENPKFLYSLFYICFLGLFYACLRKKTSYYQALFLTAILATTPEILFSSIIAYPNLLYALYFSLSTIYFWQWLNNSKTGLLVVSAFFLGLSSWVRISEPFWAVNIFLIFLLLLKNRQKFLLFLYGFIFFFLRGIWPAFQKYIFQTSKNIVFSPPEQFQISLEKIPQVFYFVMRFFVRNWLGYLFILVFVILLFRSKIKENSLILMWLFLYFLVCFLGTYFFAVSFPWWSQIGGSAIRISIFFAPLLLYATACFWSSSKN